MLIWTILLLLFALIILWRYVFEIIKLRRQLSSFPGPKLDNFLLGNYNLFSTKGKNIPFHIQFPMSLLSLATIYREHGLCRVWVAVDPYVLIFSAETIESILNSHTLISKGHAYKLFHCWLGKGLLTSTGNKWKIRRKMITPTFHYRILDQFLPTFDKNAKIFVKNLEECESEDWIDIIPLVTLCTLDVICETAMGVEIKSQNKNCMDYIQALKEFSNIHLERSVKPWLFNDFIFNLTSNAAKLKRTLSVLHGLTKKILKQRKEELKMSVDNLTDSSIGEKKKEPLLDTLIKHQFQNKDFTDQDICEEVDTFVFEGHDTTSMGICWTLYHLGLHQDIQEKVYEELQGIFGDDKDKTLTAEDIREMKYLECVIKESQRISPSVPVITRLCTEDFKIKNYTIPRGTTLSLFIYALHRDPKVFPNPEVFDPDRFLPENCIGRHPYSFIPFSAGSRNCIGQKYAMMELKTIVSRVIMNFEVESIDPPEDILCSFLLVLRPEGQLKLRLRRRK
ncbi:cytochrome P450 4c3-like isoform X1 [Centruroides vittatus]|uniref:cytochrome P450 4c3-like isoform X1 n=2 Tax=Centruroides vittatus TaxID=120091 RepID=UPI00350F5494